MRPEQILAALDEAVRPYPRTGAWENGAADATAFARGIMADVRFHGNAVVDLNELAPLLRNWINNRDTWGGSATYYSGYQRIQAEVRKVLDAVPDSVNHYLRALLARGASHLSPDGSTSRWPSALLVAALSKPSTVVPPIPGEAHVGWQARAALAVTAQEAHRLSIQLAALQQRLDVLTGHASRAVQTNGSLPALLALRDALNDRPDTDESSR
ncbi:hypothetical protein ACH4UT_10405 [Streptomyces sp. NPDC020799]|uniref:hypothetical protein n=1 Tax=Streptomyces sp. NPDC020799 TaxID=3365091 RepID=UPI0037A84366